MLSYICINFILCLINYIFFKIYFVKVLMWFMVRGGIYRLIYNVYFFLNIIFKVEKIK